MDDKITESIYFYTRADYLIVNALLWGNKEKIDNCIEKVYNNNKGMIKEAQDITPEKRFGMQKEDAQKVFESYLRRTPKNFDQEAKIKMIEIALNDIKNLKNAMKPAEKEMTLYRNVEKEDCIKKEMLYKNVDLLGLTSTSTTGQEIEYGKGEKRKATYQYKILVSPRTPILQLENDDSDENEVILPPMKYNVLSVKESEDKTEIELEPIEVLNMNELLENTLNMVKEKYNIDLQIEK